MIRQLVLSLALLSPVAVVAQDGKAPSAERPVVMSEAAQPRSALRDAGADAADPGLPQRTPRTTKTAAADKNSAEVKRPKSEGSMVGYIDDATIGSKIRIRFDAAFDNPFPDRAEFFYAKCSCYRNLAGIIQPAFDPAASGPGLGVPTTLNFQQLFVLGEYAPSKRFSAFVELPFRWLQPQGFKSIPPFPPFGSQGGISDVRLGVKLGLISTAQRSLTIQLRSALPSGDASKGLGTDHATFEPGLLYREQFTSRFSLEAQLEDNAPIGGNKGVPTSGSRRFAGNVFTYGIGPSYDLYRGENVHIAPVVELVGWHVFGGFLTDPGGPVTGAASDASGNNIVNIKFGARTTFKGRNSVYIGYGRGLTDTDWYRDIVRVEYRYVF
jgi:hypothetical protein